MRAYKVSYSADGARMVRFGGSQGEAKDHRQTIVNELTGAKKSAVEIEEIDIPTGKTELLAFVNELAAAADVREVNS